MSKKSKIWKIWTPHYNTAETDDFFHTNAILGIFSGGKGSALVVFLRLVYNLLLLCMHLTRARNQKRVSFACLRLPVKFHSEIFQRSFEFQISFLGPTYPKFCLSTKKYVRKMGEYHIQLIWYQIFMCRTSFFLKLGLKKLDFEGDLGGCQSLECL